MGKKFSPWGVETQVNSYLLNIQLAPNLKSPSSTRTISKKKVVPLGEFKLQQEIFFFFKILINILKD